MYEHQPPSFPDSHSHDAHDGESAPASSIAEMRRAMGINLDRIRNAVEVLTCRLLESKLERCIEICRCQQCVEDIYCMALNRVPALYYHSEKSFSRRLKDQGPPTDILQAIETALDHAIVTVANNPMHSAE